MKMEKIPEIIPVIDEWAMTWHCKTYIVGGFLRDQIFNKPVSDIDVCVVGKARDLDDAVEDFLMNLPRKDWVVKYTETYNDGTDKASEYMYGVLKLIPKNTNTSLPIDIIFVYSLTDYLVSFPCNISKVWFDIGTKKLFTGNLRSTINDGIVKWDKMQPSFHKYYAKIASKYDDFPFMVGGKMV